MATAAGQGGASQAGDGARTASSVLVSVLRTAAVFVMLQYFMGQRGGGDKATPVESAAERAERLGPLSQPAVREGDAVRVSVYLSEEPHPGDETLRRRPVWEIAEFVSGSGSDHSGHLKYRIPKDVHAQNLTVFAHCFVSYYARRGVSDINPIGRSKLLSTPLMKFKESRAHLYNRKNLLSGDTDAPEVPAEDDVPVGVPRMVPYWHANLTIAMVPHASSHHAHAPVQPPLHLLLEHDFETGTYAPLTFLNDFWHLDDTASEMNATTEEVELSIRVHEVELWLAGVYHSVTQSFETYKRLGLTTDEDINQTKGILVDNHPAYLALTMVVSLLHSVFDMLAFKSDVGFWSKNESMKGLSLRTIIINCVCQTVIFLYLLDNETSSVVLFSSGLGLLIEYWKVTKACKVELLWWRALLPYVRLTNRQTYVASGTSKFDAEAGRYLAYALYPLVGGYALYSLLYNEHKSWYSFVLSTFVGAVYMFGFILMCPQLYINYKLQSVAHLPWRQMTYKFLNTIIDDLFAFTIKMPALHRLSVFRDDLIFVIYLYQRWAYRVDKKRRNEYGFVAEKERDASIDRKAAGEGAPDDAEGKKER